MKRPKFQPIIEKKSDFCEISDDKPIKDFVPNQAISILTLIQRFERGQRLGVHTNFTPGSNFEHLSDEEAFERIHSESMDSDDFPPVGVHDVADVDALYHEHQQHKADFSARQKKRKAEQQAKQQQAQPSADPTPPKEGD